jgi:hypothetical protein
MRRVFHLSGGVIEDFLELSAYGKVRGLASRELVLAEYMWL